MTHPLHKRMPSLAPPEQELQKPEERYRLLFEHNPLPMWVCDVDALRFIDVNAAAIKHYGYTREEFLAMSLKDIRPPEEVPAFLAAVFGGQIN